MKYLVLILLVTLLLWLVFVARSNRQKSPYDRGGDGGSSSDSGSSSHCDSDGSCGGGDGGGGGD
ncbi:MAG: hypothetical protein M0P59_01665 [Gallionella sp.]|jgi:hypothetical protein|nr:hypothetical protein [Gallionella sp.]MCK9352848.1 hypothetical protein [Gallionella sp.]